MNQLSALPGAVRRTGGNFTLIELLIVISIIALLAALLLPVLNQARGRARSVRCAGNLKQFGVAVQLYADSHNGLFIIYSNGTIGRDWYQNPEFTRALGFHANSTGTNWPRGLLCPDWETTRKNSDLGSQEQFIGNSYAVFYNLAVHTAKEGDFRCGTASASTWANNQRVLQLSRVKSASRRILFLEANDWMSSPINTAWGPDFLTGATTPRQKFRHRTMANFLMIGGNVSTMDYPAVRTSGTFTLQETPGRSYWFAYY